MSENNHQKPRKPASPDKGGAGHAGAGNGYTVGRGCPPKHSQFQPGQSGNPGGRPKGAKNIRTCMYELLARSVIILDNGEKKTVTYAEAIVKKIMNEALAKGDLKHIQMVLTLEGAAEAEIEYKSSVFDNVSGIGADDPFARSLMSNQREGHYSQADKDELANALFNLCKKDAAPKKKGDAKQSTEIPNKARR